MIPPAVYLIAGLVLFVLLAGALAYKLGKSRQQAKQAETEAKNIQRANNDAQHIQSAVAGLADNQLDDELRKPTDAVK